MVVKEETFDFALKVFISYSHKDRKFVQRLVDSLGAYRLEIWIDQYEILGGESIREKIESAIETSDVFLVVLSPDSVTSSWVRHEIDMMITRSIHDNNLVIPVLIGECDVPRSLQGRKWIDLRSDYDKGLKELMASLRSRERKKKDSVLLSMIQQVEEMRGISLKETSKIFTTIGGLALKIREYNYAREILFRSLKLWSNNWDATILLAAAHMGLEQFDQAENVLRGMLKNSRQKARVHYNLACLYSRKAESKARKGAKAESIKKILDSCHLHLGNSISLGFISWLQRYGGRNNPVEDVVGDSDLLYARRKNSNVEKLLKSLMTKYDLKLDTRQIVFGSGATSSSDGCITGETLVTMWNGTKKEIKNINCGERVISQDANGCQSVSLVWRKMRLWEDSGVNINSQITTSSRQRLFASEGWKNAADIIIGDTIRGGFGEEILVDSLRYWDHTSEVYHINLKGNPTFIANDILVHNMKI